LTFIKELKSEDSFGEIEFFNEAPRELSARTIYCFTEVLVLKKDKFLSAVSFKEDFEAVEVLKHTIIKDTIHCYICHKKGHTAMKCLQFWKIKGNLDKRNLLKQG
jgi:hypothetical protein